MFGNNTLTENEKKINLYNKNQISQSSNESFNKQNQTGFSQSQLLNYPNSTKEEKEDDKDKLNEKKSLILKKLLKIFN